MKTDIENIVILAIESSCDDTSIAIIKNGEVLSNVVATQTIHEKYGGVVPEMASRSHEQNIIPTAMSALKEARITLKDITALAFTKGPGLLGSLLVGVSFSKALALGLSIPMIEVNHMRAHILAHFLEKPYPSFPFLCLTVSGGHTQIVKVNSYFTMKILGETIDDAAGEAFDKTGKMLGLDYPAGPLIDKYAKQGNRIYEFPFPRTNGYNFSFSGVKTAIRYFLQENKLINPNFISDNLNDICASVQHRIVSILLSKLKKAAIAEGINTIAIAGGVSANSELRAGIKDLACKMNWKYYIPQFQYCTDNAAMIGITAHYKLLENKLCDHSVAPDPRFQFTL